VVGFLTQAEAAIPAGLLPIRVIKSLFFQSAHQHFMILLKQKNNGREEITSHTVSLISIAR
jgi:hypothetical protein